MRKYIVLLIILALTTAALAHGWYDSSCCSSADCHPIASCTELIPQADGGYKWKELIFSKDMVKASHDALCHVCHSSYGISRCVYIQLGS